eukprot:TRINITY_DN13919_c0_g1_i1.p1 TRINITY_DN13919_c0_g1~~TRINITY_DN13919_c0_g1_i1.p1  ORF type:complete len:292 (+),score=38.07 TRINITY_DN13919_c0_g1_i1:113-988(+)
MRFRNVGYYIIRLTFAFTYPTVIIYQVTQNAEESGSRLFGNHNPADSNHEENRLSDSSGRMEPSLRDIILSAKDWEERFGKSHPEGDCFAPRHQSVVKFLIQSMKSAEMEMLESTLLSDSPPPEPSGRVLEDDEMFMDMMDNDLDDESDDLFTRATTHVHANAELREAIESDHVSCAERELPIETTYECFGSSANMLGRYCRFKNVCYRDSNVLKSAVSAQHVCGASKAFICCLDGKLSFGTTNMIRFNRFSKLGIRVNMRRRSGEQIVGFIIQIIVHHIHEHFIVFQDPS